MKTTAALLWGLNEKWSVEEVELDQPREAEVLVRLTASGLCHSDLHLVTGDIPMPFPLVGGHEGAGVVEEVGPGVSGIEPGDHVVLAFIPACGRCECCAAGHSNLCDLGAGMILGPQLDGTYRFHARGADLGQMCMLGTFAPYTVVPAASVVKIDEDIPLEIAALVGCGVTTGYGAAVYTAEVRAGEAVVVMGAGGVGMNAVQGARISGAEHIVVIDPVEFKREQAMHFGATHIAADVDEAWPMIAELTRGRMAHAAIITTGVAESRFVAQALSLVGKRGRVVATAVAHPTDTSVDMSLFELTLFEKQLRGCVFGSANPRTDIPRLLSLYRSGLLKLDELVSRTYTLHQINDGYQDLEQGLNIRGVIHH